VGLIKRIAPDGSVTEFPVRTCSAHGQSPTEHTIR
jgi:hypothetical protein